MNGLAQKRGEADLGATRMGRVLVRALSVAGALAGVKLGFDFGQQVDGTLLGVVAAANLGVLAAILAGAAAEWLLRRVPARHPRG